MKSNVKNILEFNSGLLMAIGTPEFNSFANRLLDDWDKNLVTNRYCIDPIPMSDADRIDLAQHAALKWLAWATPGPSPATLVDDLAQRLGLLRISVEADQKAKELAGKLETIGRSIEDVLKECPKVPHNFDRSNAVQASLFQILETLTGHLHWIQDYANNP